MIQAHDAYVTHDGLTAVTMLASGNRMTLGCSLEQLETGLEAYDAGSGLEDAFPFLRHEEREFLLSGMPPDGLSLDEQEAWDDSWEDNERQQR